MNAKPKKKFKNSKPKKSSSGSKTSDSSTSSPSPTSDSPHRPKTQAAKRDARKSTLTTATPTSRVLEHYQTGFRPQISDFAKNLKREGKVEERLLLAQMEKELQEEERKLKELEKETLAKEAERIQAGPMKNDDMYKKCTSL